jgi:transcriptional regulator with GAF, ATPase, and Fis domain
MLQHVYYSRVRVCREHDQTFTPDIHGNKVNNRGIWFAMDEWASFRFLLEKPDSLIFTHNYDIENNIPKENEMYGVKDFAAVAVWAGDKPVASISVDQLITQRSISVEQLEALRLFAGYAGLAIENARLHFALENELDEQKRAEEHEVQRRATLEKVVKLGKIVTEVADLRTTLTRIWHGIHHELGFDRLAIFLYNQDTHSVTGTFGTDNNGNLVEEWDYARPIATDKPTSFSGALERQLLLRGSRSGTSITTYYGRA